MALDGVAIDPIRCIQVVKCTVSPKYKYTAYHVINSTNNNKKVTNNFGHMIAALVPGQADYITRAPAPTSTVQAN